MADLKVGTTIGGSPVWHQGNLALVPSGNAILYKGARIYSENDKPSANELQVVSRAGDTMTGMLNVETSTDYQLVLKSSVSGSALYSFSKGNTLQSYVGTDAAGDFKVAMTDANGSWAFDGLKIAKSNGDVSLKGALVSTNTGNFDIKYGSIQFIRANSSKNVYIGAPGGTDLVLGYAQDGMTTTKIRMDSAVYNRAGGLLISDTGLIQRSAMDNRYYNQTESDARFIRLNTNTATNGYLLSKSSDIGTPHNLSMGYSGFFRHNSQGGFSGLTINVSHPLASNGANARGITFDYGSIGYGMYTYAYDSAGTKLANRKIYTEADKPTPAEIGALAAGANAVSASKLQTARTISLTGGATGSVSFDGSANASIAVTITNNSHTHSDYVKKTGDTMSGNLSTPKVLLTDAQGAEANSVTRRDFVESTVTAAGKGVKDLTITLPAGAPATGYIPVMFRTNGTSDSFVFIDTSFNVGEHPMNNCSFIGNVRASGWSDGRSYAYGKFTIYSTSERAIHSIHAPFEDSFAYVVYVETRAFPITVRVDIGTTVTAHATDVTYGTSVFKVNGQVSGNTKTIVLGNFDKDSGTYNGSNRVYDTGYNPTPEAVGALPVNGNAVTASRLQTARLIAGVPFDGTSNISISATNVGAVNKTGDAMTGNLSVAADYLLVKKSSTFSGIRLRSTDVEAVAELLNDAGAITGAYGGNTETGRLNITRNNPGTGAYAYTYISCEPNGTVSSADAIVTILNPRSGTSQGTSENSLTRKDYVDEELSKKLNTAGGTVTGFLTLTSATNAMTIEASAGNSSYILGRTAGVSNWYVGRGGSSDDVTLHSYIHNNFLALKSDHVQLAKTLRAPGAVFSAEVEVNIGSGQRAAIIGGVTSGMMLRDSAGALKWYAYYEPTLNQYRIARYATGTYTDAPLIITATGETLLQRPRTQSGQELAVNALTRKDYVDGEIAKQVSKTGDTMTGTLIITKDANAITLNPAPNTASYILGQQGGVGSWYVGKGSPASNDVTLESYTHSTYISLSSDRINVNKNIVTSVAQSELANSLTRKDYVDGKLDKSGGVLSGSVTVVGATASSVTHNENGIHYKNSGLMRWNAYHDISNDSYSIIKYNTSGAYVGSAMSIDYSSLATTFSGALYTPTLTVGGGNIDINHGGTNQMLQFHHPGVAAAMIYQSSSNLLFCQGNGAWDNTNTWLVLNNSGAAFNGIVAAPDFNVTSDRRLKSNFKAIDNPLSKVEQLTGQIYDKKLKDGGIVSEVGLIAQHVQKVQPMSVREGDDGMLSISPSGIIALLVEAVKELSERIKVLESK
ncbi:tail fiber protein [Aeromonas phage 25]|uniref:Long tail fiber protein Gp37 n=1 Tax=Aeromonas phage 25 TaxID=2911441 RepID=Q19CF5_9CAUD|nr:tail fiber protein [Aeromonas phage 25]ABF72770.1 gp36 small distal tail fiber subunit [Aeromonas phage 25]